MKKNGLVDEYGFKFYYKDDKLHHEDCPAVEYPSGYKVWCVDGKLHREDGPAIEFADGSKEWYVDGKKLDEEEFYIKTGQLEKLL